MFIGLCLRSFIKISLSKGHTKKHFQSSMDFFKRKAYPRFRGLIEKEHSFQFLCNLEEIFEKRVGSMKYLIKSILYKVLLKKGLHQFDSD